MGMPRDILESDFLPSEILKKEKHTLCEGDEF
jgi:hypothetical protein